MNRPVVLSPAADRKFEEATVWYEQKAGLGERFVDRVQETLDRIGPMPELYAVTYRNIRRARVPQFPYNVYYRILDDRIEVIAVFHHKRNPKVWQSRA